MLARRRIPVKRPASAAGPSLIDPQEVALIAYELFQQRGGEHGHDQDDWIAAERIVRNRRRTRAGA